MRYNPLTVVDELVGYAEATMTIFLWAVRVEPDHENVGHGNEKFRKPIGVKATVATVKRYG